MKRSLNLARGTGDQMELTHATAAYLNLTLPTKPKAKPKNQVSTQEQMTIRRHHPPTCILHATPQSAVCRLPSALHNNLSTSATEPQTLASSRNEYPYPSTLFLACYARNEDRPATTPDTITVPIEKISLLLDALRCHGRVAFACPCS